MTRFPELFEWCATHDLTVIRIDDNVLPTKGYAVGSRESTRWTWTNKDETFTFDHAVQSALSVARDRKLGYLMFYGDNLVTVCDVYASKEFALGYATGSGNGFIVDLFKNKRIYVRGLV